MDVLKPESKDWTQINEFLDNNLRTNVSWSLSEEYPLAFSKSNHENVRVIKDGESVLAHAVMKPNIIKTHYHLFKVGFIGSVVTDKEHRGEGLSTPIIESCIQAATEQACDFAMLWTDMFNFYAKFDFEVAGSEIALQTTQNFNAPIKESLKIMDSVKVAPQSLLKVYNKHNLQTIRQATDIQKYLSIPNTKLLTAWNKVTNNLEAYAVIGKGADFTNYIHEWGGSVSAITSLIQHQANQQKEPLTLITPPQCTNLIKTMQEHGAEKFFGVLGMIKITNPISFCKKIKKGARSLGFDNFIFEFRDGVYYFGYGEEVYQTDSSQDITRLVFGPVKPAQVHQFSEKTLEALNEIFPIPFWVWGWDSI